MNQSGSHTYMKLYSIFVQFKFPLVADYASNLPSFPHSDCYHLRDVFWVRVDSMCGNKCLFPFNDSSVDFPELSNQVFLDLYCSAFILLLSSLCTLSTCRFQCCPQFVKLLSKSFVTNELCDLLSQLCQRTVL